MEFEERVVAIARVFNEIIENRSGASSEVLPLLDELKDPSVGIDILRKTHIGIAVNRLRRVVDDPDVQQNCRNLLKRWKKYIDEENKNHIDTVISTSTEEKESESRKARRENKFESTKDLKNPIPGFERNPDVRMPTNAVRKACVDMLIKAIATGLDIDAGITKELAILIEEEIYNLHGNTSTQYRNSVRSKSFNLKDPKNNIKMSVIEGNVTPKKLASMTCEELASDELKQLRERINEETANEHRLAVTEGTPSDYFKCGRCGNKNCTYSQAQIRSSDEPMTTFVCCMDCGNRWKFS